MLVFLQLYCLVDTDKITDCKRTSDCLRHGEWPLILQVDSWADHVHFPKYSNINWAHPVLLKPTGHPRTKHCSTLFSNGTPEKFLLPNIFELWKIFPPCSSLSYRDYVVRALKAPTHLGGPNHPLLLPVTLPHCPARTPAPTFGPGLQ